MSIPTTLTLDAETNPGGMYAVSLRRETNREAMRVAAFDLVGFFDPSASLHPAFTRAGFGHHDLVALIDGIHLLATEPEQSPDEPWAAFGGRGGSDSEGRPTDMYFFGLGGEQGLNWLTCVEAAHEAYPTLLDTLGASVGATIIESTDVAEGQRPRTRNIDLPGRRVPKMLRLKAGWDYDETGEQVHLPLEEAWARFTTHNDTLSSGRGETYLDAKTMRKMRRHMEQGYARRAREQRKTEAVGFARAIAPVAVVGVVAVVAAHVARRVSQR